MKRIVLLFLMLCLFLPLLFYSPQEERVVIGPTLSPSERAALASLVRKERRQKQKARARKERKAWASSAGSNWPCPDLRLAKRYIQGLDARIAFALRCRGGIRGLGKQELFPSASTSKALLLLAFLRRKSEEEIDSQRLTLEAMIRYSDNDAADEIYYLLGDDTLSQVSTTLGLKETRFVGYWASILFSPADYARLFASLPKALPRAERSWAMRLLATITPSQSWGIARALGRPIYFKGGWRPEGGGYLVSQGALIRKGQWRASLAIFTLGFSSQREAEEAIEKTARLIFKG